MILLTILTLTLLFLLAFIVLAVSIGGAAFTVVFGDVIVCIVLLAFLIKAIIKKRSER